MLRQHLAAAEDGKDAAQIADLEEQVQEEENMLVNLQRLASQSLHEVREGEERPRADIQGNDRGREELESSPQPQIETDEDA